VQNYPTYPRSIQSEQFATGLEKSWGQSQQMQGAFQPPAPSARAVCVRTRPQRGLAGVFAFGAPEVQTETYRAKRLDLPD
jgi:hypothetical protein